MVIADGAAFGPEIERVLSLRKTKNISLILPESFEWLVLKSDLLKNNGNIKILNNPAEYIESSEYFSWEQFFTKLLIATSSKTYLKYTKKKLNPSYLQEYETKQILKVLSEITQE